VQPKQWSVEDTSFEQQIRSNIQQMQASIRRVTDQLDSSRVASCAGDTSDKSLEMSQDLAQKTEQLFREWTVHLAGETSVRHKKKFSYEKLQKAFQEEVARLKDTGRRVICQRQQAAKIEARAASSTQHLPLGDDQRDEELSLLSPPELGEMEVVSDELLFQNRVATERAEGIRRIQSQVTEVNQMFRDLASIVSEQGHQFETIEQHAEETSSNTQLAVKEVKKMSDRQRSQSERLCCMLMTSMLVLCFLVVSHLPHLRDVRSSGGLR